MTDEKSIVINENRKMSEEKFFSMKYYSNCVFNCLKINAMGLNVHNFNFDSVKFLKF